MKKIFAICLSVLMACSVLAACSSDDSNSKSENSSSKTSSVSDNSTANTDGASEKSDESSETSGDISAVSENSADESGTADSSADNQVSADAEDTDSADDDGVIIYEDESVGEPAKFEGEIKTPWADVKDDFAAAQSEAEAAADKIETVTKDDVKALTDVIVSGYDKIKDGISDNDTAKEIYKAASELEKLGDRHTDTVDLEVVRLGRNTKTLIKHLYGEAEGDFQIISGDVEIAIDSINSYADIDWDEVVSLLN